MNDAGPAGWPLINSAPKDGTIIAGWAKEWYQPALVLWENNEWVDATGNDHEWLIPIEPTHYVLLQSARDQVASWMAGHGFDTSGCDTLDDLLSNLAYRVRGARTIWDALIHDDFDDERAHISDEEIDKWVEGIAPIDPLLLKAVFSGPKSIKLEENICANERLLERISGTR